MSNLRQQLLYNFTIIHLKSYNCVYICELLPSLIPKDKAYLPIANWEGSHSSNALVVSPLYFFTDLAKATAFLTAFDVAEAVCCLTTKYASPIDMIYPMPF